MPLGELLKPQLLREYYAVLMWLAILRGTNLQYFMEILRSDKIVDVTRYA